jgi:hypothetical protein
LELLILIAIVIYFLPSMFGASKHNAAAIFTLNLLAGWTFIGWLVAFTWAMTKDEALGQVEAPQGSPPPAAALGGSGFALAMVVRGSRSRRAYVRENVQLGDRVDLVEDGEEVAVLHNETEIGLMDLQAENAVSIVKRLARGQACSGFVLDISRDAEGAPVRLDLQIT